MMRTAALLIACWFAVPVYAVEAVVCYNYSCANQARVDFSHKQILWLRQQFLRVNGPATERQAIARAIGWFERFTGEQTPTWRDKGGNTADDAADGRMDCIDHASNTTTYLRLLERFGLLRFHQVLEPVERAPMLLNAHWAAHILDRTDQQEYAVDSWFYDNGLPAVIYPLQDWLRGASPNNG